ncbi:MAG TPA: hypothetical protein VH415_01135 [Nitrososphaeraceae archaeon]
MGSGVYAKKSTPDLSPIYTGSLVEPTTSNVGFPPIVRSCLSCAN